MRLVAGLSVMFLLLAGCSGDSGDDPAAAAGDTPEAKGTTKTPGPTGETTPPKVDDEGNPLPAIDLGLMGPTNVTVLETYTFNLTSDLPSDNATAASWTFTVYNGTGANATTVVAEGSGMGLPASFNLTMVSVGNYTLVTTATAEGFNDGMATLVFIAVPVPVVLPPEDPCKDVPPQASESWSGVLGPGALNSGLSEEHPFSVTPCNDKFRVVLSTTGSDPILRIHFADGTTTDIDGNFIGGETYTYDPDGRVPPGSYAVEVRSYLTVVATYDVSVTFE